MPIIYRNQTTLGRGCSTEINIFGTLRSLDIGETVELPAPFYDAIRSGATRLKLRGLCISTHIDRSGPEPLIIAKREG